MAGVNTVAIVNPNAAGGRTEAARRRVNAALRLIDPQIEIRETQKAGDGTWLVRDALRGGARHIVVVGGDGSLHDAVNGFFDGDLPLGTDVRLSVVPAGTGGDMRRSLELPRAIDEAATRARDGVDSRIDVIRARWTNTDGDTITRHAVHAASVGLSALVAMRTNAGPITKARLGAAAYLLEGTRTAMRPPVYSLGIGVDGAPVERRAVILCAISNGATFGGGMRIAPGARLDDGWLDVTWIDAMPAWKLLTLLPTVYTGAHVRFSVVHRVRAKRVRLTLLGFEVPPLEFDGETPAVAFPVELEVVPRALLVRR